MKRTLMYLFGSSILTLGTVATPAQQPAVIVPSNAGTAGIAPNGIGVTTNVLMFSEPFCAKSGQARGVYTVSSLVSGTPWTGSISETYALPENTPCTGPTNSADYGSENYFAISPGLGSFTLNDVFATDPTGATTDAIYKNGTLWKDGIADSAPGHAGITFDSVGTFSNALIVTTASAVYGFNSAGVQQFTYPSPGGNNLLESATVAPLSNTACPGCLYVTLTTGTASGAIYTVPAGAASGTALTFVTSTVGSQEPEGIQFVPPQLCTLAGTDFSYFVSAYSAGAQFGAYQPNNGALLAFTSAQLSAYAGQALIPIERSGSILAFNPSTNGFTTFSTPIPVPAQTPAIYQFEGSTIVPSSASCTTCTGAPSTNSSNFNGTPISGGDYIWFNSNFSVKGIPSTGATLTLNSSTISFKSGTNSYNLAVPNAQVVFSPSATCTSVSFNSGTNTWVTTVPIKGDGDDEIFLSGLAWQVPVGGLSGGSNPVDWDGTFNPNGVSGISVNWKWGAAVYSNFSTNYNALGVKEVTRLLADRAMAITRGPRRVQTAAINSGSPSSSAEPGAAAARTLPDPGAGHWVLLPSAPLHSMLPRS